MPPKGQKTRTTRAEVAKRRTGLTPSNVPRDENGKPLEYLSMDDLRWYWEKHQRECIELAHRVGGNVSEIANVLGVRRQALNRLLNEREAFKEAVEEARDGWGEILVDKAVQALEEILDDPGHPKRVTAAIWALKGSEEGRRRGWADRHSDLPTVKADIKIEISTPWQNQGPSEAGEVVDAEVIPELESAKEE